MEQTPEKKYIVGSVICGLLTLLGIAATIVSLTHASSGLWIFGNCAQFVIIALVLYYAFIGYKKPHGNLLKYIILIFAALSISSVLAFAWSGNDVGIICKVVQIGLLCYVAGRLNKVKQNVVLMIIITVFFATPMVLDAVWGNAVIGAFGVVVIWLDICVAYFLRYKEHKEAGLTDAPKNK